jgi:hypothetical protein
LKKGITLVAVLVGVLAVTSGAFAAKQYLITSSSQIKDGTVKLSDLSPAARKALQGAQGIQGNSGQPGAQGPKGDAGPAGAPGKDGMDGKDGKDGKDASAPEYGAGAVYVTRGAGNPAAWAKYSTRLGSPVGDTTGGTFRFTCTAAHVTCKVGVQAAVLSDKPAGNYSVYPRVLIQKGGDPDSLSQPQTYCEYADGSTGAAPASLTPMSLATNPFATYSPLAVNIGGSADCGIDGPAGNVNEIVVPKGYYDVMTTFAFVKS